MGDIADGFVAAFRDYQIDGMPSSGVYAPEKTPIQALGVTIEAAIAQVLGPLPKTFPGTQTTLTSGALYQGPTFEGLPGFGNNDVGARLSNAGTVSTSSASSSTFNRTANGSVNLFCRGGVTVGGITVNETSTTYNTSSDERLKEEFTPSLLPGEVVDQIAPLLGTFTWKTDGSPGYGVRAQDLQAIVPEAVSVGEGDLGQPGFVPWGVDWSKLVPYLLAKVALLEQRISVLEAE